MKVNWFALSIVLIGSLSLIQFGQQTAFTQDLSPEDLGISTGKVGEAGHYSNLDSGIEDLVIPTGWWSSELFSDKDLVLRIEPVSSIDNLTNGIYTGSYIVLSIRGKDTPPPEVNKESNCVFRESNSTEVIDGKTFAVDSQRCDFRGYITENKHYQFSSPDKIIKLSLYFPTSEMDPSSLDEYISTLDSIAQSMKLA